MWKPEHRLAAADRSGLRYPSDLIDAEWGIIEPMITPAKHGGRKFAAPAKTPRRAPEIGRNVRIDTRWATTNAADIRRHAAELAALAPDVILAHGTSTVGPLLQATRTVPIVFAIVADPVGAGFVDNLARPGGNATGFMVFEYGIGGKWLELLKEIAPGVTRVAVLRDATQGSGTAQFAAIQAVSPSLRVEVNPVNAHNDSEIERAVADFARSPNGGLIVTGSPLSFAHRDLIVTLAARHKLPAIYWDRAPITSGGLISYGN